MAPRPMFSPFGYGFSPFGFSPFGFSPFGFGFGLPGPLLLFALGGIALTTFRSSRGIEAEDSSDNAGATYCLQVACYCADRQDSLFGRLQKIAQGADTQSYEGLQRLVSDACLALLRSSNDWLAGRTDSKAPPHAPPRAPRAAPRAAPPVTSPATDAASGTWRHPRGAARQTAGLLGNDVESTFNRLVVQERAKWEVEQQSLSRNAPGQPTYMVATVVVLLRKGSALPAVSGVGDMREAIAQLAADVAVEGNLLAAEVLWTPEDNNDVLDRDDLFLNFPQMVNL